MSAWLLLGPLLNELTGGEVMKQPRTWYVVADGGRARIVRKRNGENAFDTHRELVSAEIHSHTHELGTD